MAKLDLRLRDLNTGDAVNAMFETELDALTWLKDRPRFTQVLGVATHGLPEEMYKALRAAVRPLDAEEEKLRAEIERVEEAASRKLAEEEQRREEQEIAEHREAMRTADPNRPMKIEWAHSGEMRLVDPADPREITAAAREAVLAWVRERDEWVKDRGQVVGEAQVTVWPAAIPAGQGSARVLPGGQFFPMMAPQK